MEIQCRFILLDPFILINLLNNNYNNQLRFYCCIITLLIRGIYETMFYNFIAINMRKFNYNRSVYRTRGIYKNYVTLFNHGLKFAGR